MNADKERRRGGRISAERRAVLAEREREQRERVRRLVHAVDSLLPARFRSSARPNGAGARSLGGGGRALTDVLQDLRQYLIYHRQTFPAARGGMAVGARPAGGGAPLLSPEIPRESLLHAHGLLCVEVEMGGAQDWIVCVQGQGASQAWAAAPWGGSCVGHSLSQLVHRQGVYGTGCATVARMTPASWHGR